MNEETIPMNCTQFEEALPDLDRADTHGALIRESALAHAESCPDCARLLTESESLDFSLHSLAAHEAGRLAPPRVEAALLQRFRREKGIASRRRLQWQLSALGAAAVMLLAVGLSVHERHVSAPATNAATTAQTSSSASANPASGNEAANPGQVATEEPFASSEMDNSEYASAFLPLPYADDPATLDGGAIVRVILPRSALASMGLPVTYAGAGDRVSADLVVSQDGTPQAIRLVSPVSASQEF